MTIAMVPPTDNTAQTAKTASNLVRFEEFKKLKLGVGVLVTPFMFSLEHPVH